MANYRTCFPSARAAIAFSGVLIGLCAYGFAQPARPAFDVVSVKPAAPYVPGKRYSARGGPGTDSPGRITYSRVSPFYLLQQAWDVKADQIKAPGWVENPSDEYHFAITATMPVTTTREQFRLMLQSLLLERFHLRLHHEKGTRPGYELTVAPGGAKIEPVGLSVPEPGAPRRAVDTMADLKKIDGDEFPALPPGPHRISMVVGGTERVKYQEQTIGTLADGLAAMIRMASGSDLSAGLARVVDRTGLRGRYTFSFSFACEVCANSHRAGTAGSERLSDPAAAAIEPSGGAPSLDSALEKQLGLRLKKVSDIPVDVLIIDSLDRVPTPD
jgi:uncharacterized protein (TIGR03435 family)